MKTMIINGKEVMEVMDMKDVIDAVRSAYISFSRGNVFLPPIVSLDIEEHHGEMDFKTGYSKGDEIIGIKMAAGYYNNPQKYGLPSGIATICLIDAKNAVPLCILDGTEITTYRTAAAGALAASVLARKDSKHVGVIGTGSQAKMQVVALKYMFNIESVNVWGIEGLDEYVQQMRKILPEVEFQACPDSHSAVKDSDIIITATASHSALVEKRSIKPGTHINAIGCDMDGKQELDPEIFRMAKIVNDNIKECVKRGDTQHPIKAGIITAEDIHAEIGQILLGEKAGRTCEEEITIFDTTGMSIQDIATSLMVYKKVKEKGLGMAIDIISG